MSEDVPAVVLAPTALGKSRKGMLIAVAGFAAVLCVGAGIAAYVVSKNKKKEKTTPTPPPEPTPPEPTPTPPEPTPTPPEPEPVKPTDCVTRFTALLPHVYLQSADGRYLCCNDPGKMFTDGAKDNETKWAIEESKVVKGAVQIRNIYHNRYLSAESGGGINAAAAPDKLTKSEAFELVCDTTSDNVALKSSETGKYVGIQGWEVVCSAVTMGPNEILKVVQ